MFRTILDYAEIAMRSMPYNSHEKQNCFYT